MEIEFYISDEAFNKILSMKYLTYLPYQAYHDRTENQSKGCVSKKNKKVSDRSNEDEFEDGFIIGDNSIKIDEKIECNENDDFIENKSNNLCNHDPLYGSFLNPQSDEIDLSDQSYLDQNHEENSEFSEFLFRIAVKGGGCAGFEYDFGFVKKQSESDYRMNIQSDEDEISILIDKASLPFLSGACLDYEVGIMSSGFTVSNPNACRTCKCGTSFGCNLKM